MVVARSVNIDPVVEPHCLPAPDIDAVGLDARSGGLAGLKPSMAWHGVGSVDWVINADQQISYFGYTCFVLIR